MRVPGRRIWGRRCFGRRALARLGATDPSRGDTPTLAGGQFAIPTVCRGSSRSRTNPIDPCPRPVACPGPNPVGPGFRAGRDRAASREGPEVAVCSAMPSAPSERARRGRFGKGGLDARRWIGRHGPQERRCRPNDGRPGSHPFVGLRRSWRRLRLLFNSSADTYKRRDKINTRPPSGYPLDGQCSMRYFLGVVRLRPT